MAKYHINPKTGNAGLCRAQEGKCPFGGDENHYTSLAQAREAYEEKMEKQAYQVAEDSEIEGLWWVLSASGTMENFPNEKLAREWAQRMEKNAALERDHIRWEESKKQLLDILEGGGFVYLAGPGMTASSFRDQARRIESPISFHGPHRHGMTVAEARKVDKLRLTAAAMDARSGRDRHGVGLWFDVERHGTKRLKNRLIQEGHNLSSAMPPYYYGHLEYLEALESKA